jgi:Radical SAM superfamily/Iron-sulfur cluster-binding domain
LTPFDFIVDDHFRPIQGRREAIRLFRESVSMVEVEVFSYCNRRCWFCPNSLIDRQSKTEYMAEDLYLRILDQLAEADYRQMVSYSRYNEPLADRIILRRIEQATRRLPGAVLHTNTNGDYLTPQYLGELADAGLRSLNIQVYLGNDDRYDHERMRTKLLRTLDQLQLNASVVRDEPGVWLEATTESCGIRMRIYARNFELNGCNRGESVPIQIAYRRTSPCLSPFHHVYIDFNGKVMPCCNLRSDVPGHDNAIVDDLNTANDLFLVYAGETMAAWRRSLIGFDRKSGHCSSCSFVTYDDTAEHRAIHALLQQSADRVGGAACLNH